MAKDKPNPEELAEMLLAKTAVGEAYILSATETADAPGVGEGRLLALTGKVRNPRFYSITVLDRTAPRKLTADEAFQLAERMATLFADRAAVLAGRATRADDTVERLAEDLLRALRSAGALKDPDLVVRAKRLGLKTMPE